jgi:hypothetical protein
LGFTEPRRLFASKSHHGGRQATRLNTNQTNIKQKTTILKITFVTLCGQPFSYKIRKKGWPQRVYFCSLPFKSETNAVIKMSRKRHHIDT